MENLLNGHAPHHERRSGEPHRSEIPKADRRSAFFFERPSQWELPECAVPDQSLETLERTPIHLPPIEEEEIDQWADVPGNREAVSEFGAAQVRSNETFAKLWMAASAMIRVGKLAKSRLEKALAQAERECEIFASHTFVSDVRHDTVATQTLVLKVGLLLAYGALYLVGLIAEFVISNFLVQIAGIGFEGRSVMSFCFTCSIVLGPFWVLKYLESNCDEEGKKVFRHRLGWLAGASAILSVIVFALTMGIAAHQEMNSLGEEGLTSTPPLWPMFLASSAMLATSLAMGGYFLRQQLDTFYTVRSERTPQHAVATADANRLVDELGRAEELIERGEGIHARLNALLQAHVGALLRMLGRREAIREAKHKQIRAGF